MSEEVAVLEKELQFLKGELPASALYGKKMKNTEAAEDLVKFTKKVKDPFKPGDENNNPWIQGKSGGGGGCAIL